MCHVRHRLRIVLFHRKGSFKKYVCRAVGVLKKRTKTNRGRGSSLSVRSLCEKNCLILKQQAEFFLISCLAVAKCFCFGPSPAYKGVLLLKRRRHFFSFNVFLWTCKYSYCHCIYSCVENIDLLCWVYKKINSSLSFHPPTLYSKLAEASRTFFWEGGNSVKWTYVERGCQKLEVSSELTFWMAPKVIYHSQDVQFFVFLNIPWFTKSFMTSWWVLVHETGCIFEYIFWTATH